MGSLTKLSALVVLLAVTLLVAAAGVNATEAPPNCSTSKNKQACNARAACVWDATRRVCRMRPAPQTKRPTTAKPTPKKKATKSPTFVPTTPTSPSTSAPTAKTTTRSPTRGKATSTPTTATATPTGPTPTASPWTDYTRDNPKTCPGTPDKPCTIPADDAVLLDSGEAKARSIIVRGAFSAIARKDETVRVTTAMLLGAGPKSRITIDASASADSRAIVHLRFDPESYDDIPGKKGERMWILLANTRVLACMDGCTLTVRGFPLKRTWTLLAERAPQGAQTIVVEGDVSDWRASHVIGVAPSDNPAMWDKPDVGPESWRVGGEAFQLTQDPKPHPKLKNAFILTLNATVKNPWLAGERATGIQAEVINLNRTVVIMGDDFTPNTIPLPEYPNAGRQRFATTPANVIGLHTLIAGDDASGRIHYALVKGGGQRGWQGHYPLHLHMVQDCPTCELVGNAVWDSQQRGIVVHRTHRSLVRDNVLWHVRGAGIYIEEGNELHNRIERNVYICDVGRLPETIQENGSWRQADACTIDGAGIDQQFGDPARVFGGCRITGTDNVAADCSQQSAIWTLSATNNFVGNRLANAYNGIFYQSSDRKDGRSTMPWSFKRVFPMSSPFGRTEGNVCHSNYRFGFYPDQNWPSNVDRDLESLGLVRDLKEKVDGIDKAYPCVDLITDPVKSWCSVRWFKKDGSDNGQDPHAVVLDQLDWGNSYVGQYDVSHLQYVNLRSIRSNSAGFYLKNTKDFPTHNVSLIKGGEFTFPPSPDSGIVTYKAAAQNDVGSVLMGLPGASVAMVIEDVVFAGNLNENAVKDDPYNRDGGHACALGLNQESKWGVHDKNLKFTPSTIEGGLSNPTVVLVNVSFAGVKDRATQFNNPTSWIRFGALDGNPFHGSVNAYDDSLCGSSKGADAERYKVCKSAPFRGVGPKFNTHLLKLPNSPCKLASQYDAVWHQRFDGGIVCTKQLRRLDVWSDDQGEDLVLFPPGCNALECAQRSLWLAYQNKGYQPNEGSQWSMFAQGYPFTVFANEDYAGTWKLRKASGAPVDPRKVWALEFSDLMFGLRFGRPETLSLDLGQELGTPCVAKSQDARTWITQYGPVKRGGGSCAKVWVDALKVKST